jgi:hypothetical protein
VPLRRMELPFTAALIPGGSPVAVRMLYGAVPPATTMAPLKPDWFTVQAEDDRLPRTGPAIPETSRMRWLFLLAPLR